MARILLACASFRSQGSCPGGFVSRRALLTEVRLGLLAGLELILRPQSGRGLWVLGGASGCWFPKTTHFLGFSCSISWHPVSHR